MERVVGLEPTPMAWKATMLPLNTILAYMEEGTGFEPARVLPLPAFQAGTISHSDTLPYWQGQ